MIIKITEVKKAFIIPGVELMKASEITLSTRLIMRLITS